MKSRRGRLASATFGPVGFVWYPFGGKPTYARALQASLLNDTVSLNSEFTWGRLPS